MSEWSWHTAGALFLIAGLIAIFTEQPRDLIVIVYGMALVCFVVKAALHYLPTPPHTGKE